MRLCEHECSVGKTVGEVVEVPALVVEPVTDLGITDITQIRYHPTSGDAEEARRSARAAARDTAKSV
ncbi:hypothetical protein BH18ACT9_BH18ACT9_02680 [soil metagenome]